MRWIGRYIKPIKQLVAPTYNASLKTNFLSLFSRLAKRMITFGEISMVGLRVSKLIIHFQTENKGYVLSVCLNISYRFAALLELAPWLQFFLVCSFKVYYYYKSSAVFSPALRKNREIWGYDCEEPTSKISQMGTRLSCILVAAVLKTLCYVHKGRFLICFYSVWYWFRFL